MLKNFLLVSAFAGAFFACSDSDSTSVTQEALPEVEDESSSSEQSAGLSSEHAASSSSAKKTEGESSAEDEAESSSSEEVVESSSSEDKLPFDTTGVEPKIYRYGPLLEHEDSTYFKEEFGDKIKDAFWVATGDSGYCYTIDEPTGELGGGYVTYGPAQYMIIEQNDSLLFSDSRNCSTYDWGDCRDDEYAYTQKITVGEDTFYYGEFKSTLLLIKLTDSTITQWTVRNPRYVPPVQDTTVHGWGKRWFEGDSLVTFVNANPNSDYVDTIFIEKYNVKIIGVETTWIFENDTCTKKGFVPKPGSTPAESCYDYIKYYNEAAKCIQRNMGLSDGNFARLCRPEPYRYKGWNVWCILDGEKEDFIPDYTVTPNN